MSMQEMSHCSSTTWISRLDYIYVQSYLMPNQNKENNSNNFKRTKTRNIKYFSAKNSKLQKRTQYIHPCFHPGNKLRKVSKKRQKDGSTVKMTKIMVPDEKQKYEKYPKAGTFSFKKYIRRIN